MQNNHSRRHHHFFVAALRSPLQMGALVPSSRGLARALAAAVDVSKPGMVIELGAGTGVVTHALLQHGVPPERLLVIERDKTLHALLTHHFRQLTILQADAMQLDDVLAGAGVTEICAIVSSLPFLSMPQVVREGIQRHMAALIGEEGIIIQFTYGPKSPLPAAQLGLKGKRAKFVVANVPPAHVWVYRRERRKKAR